MATQRIRTTRKVTKYVRNSQTTTDRQGRKHCKTCGAYVGNRGRK